MALNGVNAPLAMVGQDAIWLDVFVTDFVRAGQALSHRHSVNTKDPRWSLQPPPTPRNGGVRATSISVPLSSWLVARYVHSC